MQHEPCASTQPIRQAALRQEAAEAYPFLPAQMWTAASHLAEIVAINRATPRDVLDRLARLLSDRDFVFRGGWAEDTWDGGQGTLQIDRRAAPLPA